MSAGAHCVQHQLGGELPLLEGRREGRRERGVLIGGTQRSGRPNQKQEIQKKKRVEKKYEARCLK